MGQVQVRHCAAWQLAQIQPEPRTAGVSPFHRGQRAGGGQPLRCHLGYPPRGQLPGGPGPHEVAWTKPAGLCADGGAGRATPSDTERNALRLEHSMGTERNWCASGLRIASPSGIVSVIS